MALAALAQGDLNQAVQDDEQAASELPFDDDVLFSLDEPSLESSQQVCAAVFRERTEDRAQIGEVLDHAVANLT